MNKFNRRSCGFTLMEIMVVLIIIGVLVAMALPNLFSQIERNRSQEAIKNIGLIRGVIEACGLQNNYDFAQCNNWSLITMDDPSNSTFTYTLVPGASPINPTNAYGVNTYSVTATRVGNTNNTIIANRDISGVTCKGSGNYVGVC